MDSLRKWFYKPKRDDTSLLAQFFYADEALNMVAAELDSFDGRKDPERCTMLVNHLRQCQDKVLTICNRVMDQLIPDERANRDFRVKFPDDVMQENLAGQLWFGAECLAAGSSIMNREHESIGMRPLAKALTKALEHVRNLLREECFRSPPEFGERLTKALKSFDRLFAEFELYYVSAMVPVKTSQEYELQQNVIVLFSETLQRALRMKLLSQEQVDDCDPALMFTIPRLAIVSGLLVFPDGPLCLDKPAGQMSEMFRPFQTLLHRVRELLWTLSKNELFTLEKMLCSMEEPSDFHSASSATNKSADQDSCSSATSSYPIPDLDDFVTQFYNDYPNYKQFISDFYTTSRAGQTGQGADADTAEEAYKDEKEEEEWTGDVSESETLVTEYNADGITLSSTDEQQVPNSSSGFLLANQVVGEQPSDELPVPLVGGGSLPDSDSQEDLASQQAMFEAMSAVQDSLTSLLGSNVQSARDSGVASLDRSPEAPPNTITPSSSGLGGCPRVEAPQLNWQQVYNNTSNKHCSCTQPTEVVKDKDSKCCASCDGVQNTPGLVVSPVPRFNYGENWEVLQQQPSIGGGSNSISVRRLKSAAPSPRKAGRREASPLRPSKRQQMTTRSMVLEVPCEQRLRDITGSYSSSCSSCRSSSVLSTDSFCSSETSSFNSDCQDDEEIALAMQAAEIANRNETRSKFRSSEDLVHRLFICVAGVADQLQSNFVGDLRNILKCVFLMNVSEQPEEETDVKTEPDQGEDEDEDLEDDSLSSSPAGSTSNVENAEEAMPTVDDTRPRNMSSISCPRTPPIIESPPRWVPDHMAPQCMSCKASFTVVRRRHHCRHCGKVFCARCSPNSVPLPRYGHLKPVRVCNRCYMYQVTPFTMDDVPVQSSSSS